MIRLSLRQFRVPAIAALASLIAVAVLAALSGPDLAHAYAKAITACRPTGDCTSAMQAFLRNDTALRRTFDTLMGVVPGLIGVFWGAPLIARETESGTFPLVWTQSITRTRWLLIKLATIGVASMLVAAIMSLIVTWWAHPLDRAGAAAYATFGQRDLVPIGDAAFAFVLGATAGLLIRRTVPAMAVTLFAFIAVRVTTTFGIRPRIFSPAHQVLALDPDSTGFGSAVSLSSVFNSLFNRGKSSALDPVTPTIPNAWIQSIRVVDGGGHDLTNTVINATCPGVINGPRGGAPAIDGHLPVPQDTADVVHNCVAKIGATYHELVTYQPANRY